MPFDVTYTCTFRFALASCCVLYGSCSQVAMTLMPPGPIIPGFCPISCLDIVSLGIFIVADQEAEATFCLCDQPTLEQAANVSNVSRGLCPERQAVWDSPTLNVTLYRRHVEQ